ncbi:MAG: nicotinate-nucleotide adenylyltransferase [Bariatricus sp.]
MNNLEDADTKEKTAWRENRKMIDVGVVYGRFQILHLKHLEYILAAKMRCRKLYVGISLPDESYIQEDSEMDEERKKSSNPLTYFERFEMIRDCLLDFKVPREAFDIIPFPIERPEYLRQYVPEDAVCFLSICDEKTKRDEEVLRSMGYAAEVLWRRDESEKGITGTQVRQRILADEKWNDLVPKSVYEYIISHGIDNRIKYTK